MTVGATRPPARFVVPRCDNSASPAGPEAVEAAGVAAAAGVAVVEVVVDLVAEPLA